MVQRMTAPDLSGIFWPVFVQPWSSGPPSAVVTFTAYDWRCRRRLPIAREAVGKPLTTECFFIVAQEIRRSQSPR